MPEYLAPARGRSRARRRGRAREIHAALAGDLHLHSNWSDGGATIEAMARKAVELGHHYLALTDHSPQLTVAHGLTPERLREQLEIVARLNDELAPFRILTGIEVDILDDGSLDQDDDLLAELDVVVASVHSKLRMGEQPMTDRMVAAMANPNTDILGHCTGRLVLGKGRPESTFDAELVFGVCAHFDKAVEINCRPERLDPPMRLLEHRRRRRVQGVDRQRRPRGRSARVAALRLRARRRGRRRRRPDRQHLAGRPAPRVDRVHTPDPASPADDHVPGVRKHTKSGRAPKQQRATSGVTPEVPSSG